MFSKQKKLSPQDEEIANLSFSIILKESGKTIDFVAQNREDFVNWTDGLKLLLADRLENAESLEEVKVLVNLELRIRLLELVSEGVQVPNDPPQIPSLPDNFNFSTAS